MDKKKILILSVILAVLAVGILLKSWMRSAEDAASSVRVENALLSDFDLSKIERIVIGRPLPLTRGRRPESPTELVKEKGVWKVKSLWNVAADPGKVERFLQKFRTLRGELRGKGAKLFPDFGVQETEALSIKFFGPHETLRSDLWVGTKQAGENGFFIRRASSDEVYLVELNTAEILGISDLFDKAASSGDTWADLNLFKLEPEKVTRITVYQLKEDQKNMVTGLECSVDPKDRSRRVWKFLRKEMTLPLDPIKVSKFIATMNGLRAEKAVDPLGKGYGLEKPVWQLAVTEGAKKTILNAGPKDEKDSRYYLSRSIDSSIFALQSDLFQDLSVDDTDFIKDTVAPDTGSEQSA